MEPGRDSRERILTMMRPAGKKLALKLGVVLLILLAALLQWQMGDGLPESPGPSGEPVQAQVVRGAEYGDREHVAEYLHLYGELPPNYLTKEEARELGWDPAEGNLWEVAPGMSIGGDRFGNREGLLPEASGRIFYECDVDYKGGFRGEDRLVYSSDGMIWYTEDHYGSFVQMYGE